MARRLLFWLGLVTGVKWASQVWTQLSRQRLTGDGVRMTMRSKAPAVERASHWVSTTPSDLHQTVRPVPPKTHWGANLPPAEVTADAALVAKGWAPAVPRRAFGAARILMILSRLP